MATERAAVLNTTSALSLKELTAAQTASEASSKRLGYGLSDLIEVVVRYMDRTIATLCNDWSPPVDRPEAAPRLTAQELEGAAAHLDMGAVIAECRDCRHQANVFVDQFAAEVFVPDVGRSMVCSGCGGRKIETRPAWHLAKRPGMALSSCSWPGRALTTTYTGLGQGAPVRPGTG